ATAPEHKHSDQDVEDGLELPFADNTIIIRIFIRNYEGNEGAQAILSDCIINKSPLTAQLTYEYRSKRSLEKLEGEKLKEAIAALDEDDYEFIVYGGADETNRLAHEIRKWIALLPVPALREAEGNIESW